MPTHLLNCWITFIIVYLSGPANASDNVVALHCECEMGRRAQNVIIYVAMGDGRGSGRIVAWFRAIELPRAIYIQNDLGHFHFGASAFESIDINRWNHPTHVNVILAPRRSLQHGLASVKPISKQNRGIISRNNTTWNESTENQIIGVENSHT